LIGDVAFEVAEAEPAAFAAVTRARSREPTSADVGMYELAVAPAMSPHELVADAQRNHWYANVIGVEPVQVPLVTASGWPSLACPEIDGRTVFAGGVALEAYVAVYVVAACGATMLWVCAPPSDHDWNVYVVPPRVCGVVAEIEFADPTITVRVNGAVADEAFTTSWRPAGDDANVSSVVIGFRLTLVVCDRPPESVAVSRSSRCDGYSWSGATKDPPATPGQDWCV
jgi:hypothetical protein